MKNVPLRTSCPILVLLFLLIAQAVFSMTGKSATFDEVAHLPAGYSYLVTRDFRLNPEQPPLIKILAAIPLLFLKVNFAENDNWKTASQYQLGYEFFYRLNPGDRLLFWGRIPIVLLAVMMACFVWRWAKELYGWRAGLLALFLCCLSPDVIAHSQLVTMDLGAACFSFIFFYYFYRLLHDPTRRHVLWSGVFLGLTLVSKFTTLLFLLPAMILVCVFFWPRHLRENWKENFTTFRWSGARAMVVTALVVGFIAYNILLATYLYRYQAIIGEGQMNMRWSDLMPQNGYALSAITALRNSKVFPEALVYGLLYITRSPAASVRSFYLLGEVSRAGWWYYFVVTFLFKTPIPLLILLAVSAWLYARDGRHKAEIFLIVPAVTYFALASYFKLNIGHRHLLPMYPFLFVFSSRAVAVVEKNFRLLSWAFSALLVWYVVEAIRIYPDYLAYFNEFAGGPRNGYQYLSDSNLDW